MLALSGFVFPVYVYSSCLPGGKTQYLIVDGKFAEDKASQAIVLDAALWYAAERIEPPLDDLSPVCDPYSFW